MRGEMGFLPAVGVVTGCAIPPRHCAAGTPPVLGGRGVFGQGGTRGPGFGPGGGRFAGWPGAEKKSGLPDQSEYLAAAELISSPLQASAPSLAVHSVICRPVALAESMSHPLQTTAEQVPDRLSRRCRVAPPPASLPRDRRQNDANGAKPSIEVAMDVDCFYQVPGGCEADEISAVGTRVLKLEHGRAVDFSACRAVCAAWDATRRQEHGRATQIRRYQSASGRFLSASG